MATVRSWLLAFVAGVAAVHLMAAPPAVTPIGAAVSMAIIGAGLTLRFSTRLPTSAWAARAESRWPSRLTFVLCLMAAAGSGLSYGSLRVSHRLADVLHSSNEDKVTRVVLRVAELPRLDADSRSFVADVLSSIPEGVPTRLQVRWNAPGYSGPYGARGGRRSAEFPEIIPGQVWRMALVLRTPFGARNPNGFDYEGHLFARGIRATGTVRGTPVLLRDDGWAGLSVAAQRARHVVREAMLPHIAERRWGGVLLALAIGDQASVAPADWQTFNRSGLTHLVSISGSHVTLIAALAGIAVNFLWRRLSWRGRALAERVPAQLAAACVALWVAWLYCLLAGWGVPARRTFVMLAIMAASLALRLPLGPTHVLAAAAFAVVLMDPWSLLASGFWLSFLAVYVLMASSGWWGSPLSVAPRDENPSPIAATVRTAAALQLAVTLALMPPLAFLFNEISLVSPLANAYAIPLLGAVVTPLALLLAALSLLPGLEFLAGMVAMVAHALLLACMWPTAWLAQLPGASFPVATAPWALSALAMVGIVLALLPRGFPSRWMGWALMLPGLLWRPPALAPGDWELYALDVGQGSALVLRTAGHVLVYDTGMRHAPDSDAAQRVLVPFLRSMGIRSVDVLVISHGDLDHAGGLRSLLEAMPVRESYASFDIDAWLSRESRLLATPGSPSLPHAVNTCAYGQTWRVDEVGFAFLWPPGDRSIDIHAGTRERNRHACVLQIRGAHHALLLPGDIGADEEKTLVARGLSPADVVLAAHHGSRHSSAPPFVEAVQASHVIAQAGRWNRYGHPADVVRRRWESEGAVFLDTAGDGAILARSVNGELIVQGERDRRPRYWSG